MLKFIPLNTDDVKRTNDPILKFIPLEKYETENKNFEVLDDKHENANIAEAIAIEHFKDKKELAGIYILTNRNGIVLRRWLSLDGEFASLHEV